MRRINYLKRVTINDIIKQATESKEVINDFIKVLKSLENRGILLKGTTRNITSQKGGF